MEARGRVLLKIMGIIMIVGGALSIIMSIILIAAVAVLSGYPGTGGLIVGIIITILAGIAELIAGIICTKNAGKPENATKCMVWAIIVIVLQLVGFIITLIGAGTFARMNGASVSSGGSTVVSIIFGLAVPVLAIVGAVLNKKSAGGDVSFAGIANDMAAEVKNIDDDVVGLAKDAKETAQDVAGDVKEFADKAVDKAGDVVEDVKDKAADVVGDVKEFTDKAVDDVKDFAENAKDKAADVVDDVKDKFDGEN